MDASILPDRGAESQEVLRVAAESESQQSALRLEVMQLKTQVKSLETALSHEKEMLQSLSAQASRASSRTPGVRETDDIQVVRQELLATQQELERTSEKYKLAQSRNSQLKRDATEEKEKLQMSVAQLQQQVRSLEGKAGKGTPMLASREVAGSVDSQLSEALERLQAAERKADVSTRELEHMGAKAEHLEGQLAILLEQSGRSQADIHMVQDLEAARDENKHIIGLLEEAEIAKLHALEDKATLEGELRRTRLSLSEAQANGGGSALGETQLRQLEDELAAARSQIVDLEAAAVASSHSLEAVAQAEAQAHQQLSDARVEVDEYKKRVAVLEAAVGSGAPSASTEVLERELAGVRELLAAEKAERADLQARLEVPQQPEQSTGELQMLQETVKELEASVVHHAERCHEFEMQADKAVAELKQAKSESQRLERELVAAMATRSSADANVTRDADKAVAELQQARSETQRLERELAAAKAELSSAEGASSNSVELEVTNQMLEQSREEHSQTKVLLATTEARLASVREELDRSGARIEDLEAQLAEQSIQVSKFQEDARQAVQGSDASRSKLEVDLEEATKKAQADRRRVLEVEGLLEVATAREEGLEAQLAAALLASPTRPNEAQIQESQALVTKLQADLELANATITDLRQQTSKASDSLAQVAEADTHVQAMKAVVEDATSKAAAWEKEAQRYKEQAEEKAAQVAQLQDRAANGSTDVLDGSELQQLRSELERISTEGADREATLRKEAAESLERQQELVELVGYQTQRIRDLLAERGDNGEATPNGAARDLGQVSPPKRELGTPVSVSQETMPSSAPRTIPPNSSPESKDVLPGRRVAPTVPSSAGSLSTFPQGRMQQDLNSSLRQVQPGGTLPNVVLPGMGRNLSQRELAPGFQQSTSQRSSAVRGSSPVEIVRTSAFAPAQRGFQVVQQAATMQPGAMIRTGSPVELVRRSAYQPGVIQSGAAVRAGSPVELYRGFTVVPEQARSGMQLRSTATIRGSSPVEFVRQVQVTGGYPATTPSLPRSNVSPLTQQLEPKAHQI
mmetsp:Transcript_52895/g.113393  ORF Transcript_52895/g.113393 Transcript_52895/m.113393 type:complete len:1044 (+) Transcript_52895:48-3179(+)